MQWEVEDVMDYLARFDEAETNVSMRVAVGVCAIHEFMCVIVCIYVENVTDCLMRFKVGETNVCVCV
jgi:hypothetical protein